MSRRRTAAALLAAASLALTACGGADTSVTAEEPAATTPDTDVEPAGEINVIDALVTQLAADRKCLQPMDENQAAAAGRDVDGFWIQQETNLDGGHVPMPAHADLRWCAEKYNEDDWDTLILGFDSRTDMEAALATVDYQWAQVGKAYGSTPSASQQWLLVTRKSDRVEALMRMAASVGGIWLNSRHPSCTNPLVGGPDCPQIGG
jgi:hypothetical protein